MTLRFPGRVLAVAAVAIAALAILGRGVADELRPVSVTIADTESGRAARLAEEHFGDSAPFAILLQGPPAALERQGPKLIRKLREDPNVSTISPWDRGSVDRLRPGPRKALILVDFRVDTETAVKQTVPYLDRTLEEEVSPPVEAAQSGFASLLRAVQDETVDSTHRAELIAVPFLLIVLLLVFRSPVAAAIPLAFGAIAVVSSRGVLAIAANWIAIDGFALTVTTMMGLALGVDYALLMVSRFREELAAGAGPREAALMTRRTAGRTTAFAGSTLFLAMLTLLFVMPGTLLLSLAGAAIVVVAISVIVAALVGPPLLMLLGENVNRWRIGRATDGAGVMVMVRGALSRPLAATLLIGAAVLLLAAPALALKTGPPSAEQLPEGNQAREESELIAEAIGPGWDAPFVLVAVSEQGPITNPGKLASLSRWQRRIAADPDVQAVIGPARIGRQARPLRRAGDNLLAERGELTPKAGKRLAQRLGDAASGVKQLREGLSSATYGAGLLATGTGRAGSGAEELAGGIAKAASGAEEAAGAIERLADGSKRLTEGQKQARLGAQSLEDEAAALGQRIEGPALEEARSLRASLQRAAATDPSLAEQARQAERLVEVLAIARNDTRQLETRSKQLSNGEDHLVEGNERLQDGAEQLAEGAEELPGGLAQLEGGAGQLVDGLGQLRGGADVLERKLAEGYRESRPLQTGLRRANVRVAVSSNRGQRKVDRLRRNSPGIFDSGYFVLSSLEGAPPKQREQAAEVVDLERGGQAARMVVIPRYTFNTDGSRAVNQRLKGDAAQLASANGVVTGVTGGAAQLIDYTDTISDRIPLMIAVITIATFLILVIVLRAIPLAAIAVILNLVTVAVAFGVLTLLFEVPAGWPLGGRSYVDAIGAAGIFGIVFGLSIDYAVFLLMRMREHYENETSNREAILFGLERTARVITGAAAIMLAVFVAFAGADLATVSQLGTGLAVAVFLDATVIRIVLLPALMLLLGERVWWLPRRLERFLPKIDLHGSRAG